MKKNRWSRVKQFSAIALLLSLFMPVTPAFAAVEAQLPQGVSVSVTGSPALGSSSFQLNSNWTQQFKDGTGINQANKYYQARVTLAGSASQTYDLDAANTGMLGETVTFGRITFIGIRRTDAAAATTQDELLKIGGDFILTKYLVPGGDTLTNTTLPLHPAGRFEFIAPDATGVAVTATTGDQVTITNASSSDTCTFEIIILGS